MMLSPGKHYLNARSLLLSVCVYMCARALSGAFHACMEIIKIKWPITNDCCKEEERRAGAAAAVVKRGRNTLDSQCV